MSVHKSAPTNPPQYSIEDLGDSKSPLIASKSDVVKSLPFNPSKRKCGACNKIGTVQTAKGEYAEAHGDLPQNWSYWCQKHWDEGVELENEAMYG
jgi:hypothetical protein